MMENGDYFTVIALLVAELFKILIYIILERKIPFTPRLPSLQQKASLCSPAICLFFYGGK